MKQVWKLDKIVIRNESKCCSCGSASPRRKIFITVKGFYIPPGQCFPKEINVYF